MTLVQSLALETGQRPERRTRRETAVRPRVLEAGVRREHLQHLLGVRFPVGRAVQQRAGPEAGRGEGEEVGLDQPPFVVPLLGPGVGEVDAQPVQGVRGEHLAQQDDGVAVGDPDVGETAALGEVQQIALAGGVHIDGEDIGAGIVGGHPRGGLAHPEPDLQHDGTVVAEQLTEIDDMLTVDVQPPERPQPLQGVRLPGRHPAPPGLEAPDPPLEVRPGRIGLGPVGKPRLPLPPGVPQGDTGEMPRTFGSMQRLRHNAPILRPRPPTSPGPPGTPARPAYPGSPGTEARPTPPGARGTAHATRPKGHRGKRPARRLPRVTWN